MAETYYRIKLSTLTEIGDAIRAKSGATGDIAVTSLATSILDLSPADGADEWDGTGIVIAPIEPVEPNTFTINGTSYQMENRMTWYAWTRSDYNTDGFSCANENDYVYEAESKNKVTDAKGNDVLGTTYIVEGGAYLIKEAVTTDELSGTWVFNDTVNIPENVQDWTLNFQCNGVQYTLLSVHNIQLAMPIVAVLYDGSNVYEPSTGWYEQYYRTITITSKLSEVTNGDTLLTWLKANATKQGAASLISFTIDGTSYQAEEGMTWGEWVASKYNTAEYVANGNSIYNGTGLLKFVKETNAHSVLTTDTIISNHAYFTSYSGGVD